MEQLHKLKEAVIAKNEKIRELESFIQKISKMAFMDSIETTKGNITMKEYLE